MHIPKKHYVGIVSRSSDVYHLAFMTEDGDDASSIKRKQTVDTWVGRNRGKSESVVLDNVAMAGFRLSKGICERHRSGVRTKWRVEDPRGFEIEITWQNLEYILENCVIDRGEILADAIWARESGDNYLLVAGTELHSDTITINEVKPCKLSDLKVGNTVILKKNRDVGVYLGKFRDTMVFNMQNDCLYQVKKPTVLGILSESTMSDKEAEEKIISHRWDRRYLITAEVVKITYELIKPNYYGNVVIVDNNVVVGAFYYQGGVARKSRNDYFTAPLTITPTMKIYSAIDHYRTKLGNEYEQDSEYLDVGHFKSCMNL